ncbi:MAG: ABC transporter ATP-binding protein [Chloroflexi bacterium]|nr:ABC transporter ATP-binding protein [Chloroflexota bacterium]MBI4505641.1 ABC transporter ATP-binding protein [Chloroflexota bacterium]
MSALLKVTGLHVAYGPARVIHGVDLEINSGEIRALLGANGAGKTTILKAILGLVRAAQGAIEFPEGRLVRGLPPHKIAALGIGWVPEGRQVFSTLSVYDNLLMGAFNEHDQQKVQQRIEEMYKLFPIIETRRGQIAGSLSGGEQQMLAIARALMSAPTLLLMDEPSLGLAPRLVRDVFELVRTINQRGVSILMVEQNARQALRVANWAYLLEGGHIVGSGTPTQIEQSDAIKRAYIGRQAS